MSQVTENVAIIGASDQPERFAYRADKLLKSFGHVTFLINPKFASIEGQTCFQKLSDLELTPIQTVTLYVNPKILESQLSDIIQLAPKRVIFNPGTEDVKIEARLSAAGIKAVRACTLVMLNGGTF